MTEEDSLKVSEFTRLRDTVRGEIDFRKLSGRGSKVYGEFTDKELIDYEQWYVDAIEKIVSKYEGE